MHRRIIIRRLRILRRWCSISEGVVVIDRSDADAIWASRILLTRRLSLGGICLRSVGRVFGSVEAGANGGVDSLDVAVALGAWVEVALAEAVEDDGGVYEHAYE